MIAGRRVLVHVFAGTEGYLHKQEYGSGIALSQKSRYNFLLIIKILEVISIWQKKQFKAESKRLLDLMINSIYTHKEIFLRELISNASDAIDKLLYLSPTDSGTGLSRSDFYIRIEPDRENGCLKYPITESDE